MILHMAFDVFTIILFTLVRYYIIKHTYIITIVIYPANIGNIAYYTCISHLINRSYILV